MSFCLRRIVYYCSNLSLVSGYVKVDGRRGNANVCQRAPLMTGSYCSRPAQWDVVEALGRFELPTCGLGNRRSIHLSYRAEVLANSSLSFLILRVVGRLRRSRTMTPILSHPSERWHRGHGNAVTVVDIQTGARAREVILRVGHRTNHDQAGPSRVLEGHGS